MTVIKLENIKKSFGNVVANDGIDLEISKGEIHCLLGENGAGKTTLMKIVCGLYSADEGSIYVQGRLVNFCDMEWVVGRLGWEEHSPV